MPLRRLPHPPRRPSGAILRLAQLATLFAAALGAAAAANADTLERIRSRGSIVIGHRDASIPLSYLADGQPMGYSIDVCHRLVDAIARHLGKQSLKIEYRMVTSATRFDAVERGEVDLECGSTTNTAKRRERVAFTIAHFIASSRIMVRSSMPVERIEQLDGRTIASTAGTTNIQSVQKEARLKGIALTVVPARDHAEAAAWVLDGRVQGFAMDDIILYGLQANAADPSAVKIIGKPITIEPYAVAFERNNPALKSVVDAEMRRLIFSRELHALYDKWFMQPIPPKGTVLNMKMSYLLSDSLRFPSDYVPD